VNTNGKIAFVRALGATGPSPLRPWGPRARFGFSPGGHGPARCSPGGQTTSQGHGAVRLCLLNEILGRSSWAPVIFGCQAPDTGNAEIIAHYGSPAQKERYLRPLLDGEVFSCFSMTEPEGGADPTQFRTRAVRDGDEWVLNGWKFFSSNAKTAAFVIVMAVTNPDVSPYQGMSMFIVPSDLPGIEIVRNVGLGSEPLGEGDHALIHYTDVRMPADALLGEENAAFAIAQTRLGGGRIHHAMRTIGQAQKALDMLCERALSRYTAGGKLSEKQFVQGYIADSYAQLTPVPAVRPVHRVGDRQVQRLPEGPQGHRRDQGADAFGAA
jgi:acyl-CoA dehydrogenase